MSTKKKILVIEDEADIQELIEYNLLKQGYEVVVQGNGKAGLEAVKVESPDLVLLDIMLPELDGLSVCREIRTDKSFSSLPIIMLTAKSEEMDIVVGLEIGADDYLTKPFSPNVLVARVRAHLRRIEKIASRNAVDAAENQEQKIIYGPLKICKSSHEIFFNEEKIQFTLAEFKLLAALAENPGKVFTRDQLISIIAGEDTYLVGRNIDVHVRSIRKKLGDDAHIIETIRGVGYKCQG